jgi:hypothetical protein
MVVSEFESENNMNNWKNNTKRLPRQLARRKSARGCEPSSLMLPSQLSSLLPYRHSVTDGDTTRTFTYHADGQLATANNERADANRSTVGRGDPTAPDEFIRCDIVNCVPFPKHWQMEFGVATGYARPFAFNCQYRVRRDGVIAPYRAGTCYTRF